MYTQLIILAFYWRKSSVMPITKVATEYVYTYTAKETDVEQSFELICHVKIRCEFGEYTVL